MINPIPSMFAAIGADEYRKQNLLEDDANINTLIEICNMPKTNKRCYKSTYCEEHKYEVISITTLITIAVFALPFIACFF